MDELRCYQTVSHRQEPYPRIDLVRRHILLVVSNGMTKCFLRFTRANPFPRIFFPILEIVFSYFFDERDHYPVVAMHRYAKNCYDFDSLSFLRIS